MRLSSSAERMGIAALLAIGLLLASSVSAQEAEPQQEQGNQTVSAPQSPDSKELAKQAYANGKSLFEQGVYAEALKEFQKAYELSPHPVVLKSIAECQVRSNDIQGAIESFERYLAERPSAPDAEDTKTKIANLKGALGRVDITSIPDGASVEIDGESTGKTTPLSLEVNPGMHTVNLMISGFKPLQKDVMVKEGETKALPVNFFDEGERVALEPFPTEEAPVEEEVEEESEGPDYTAAWVCVGITGAALIAGSVFGLVAMSDQSEFDDNPSESLADSAESMALAADISFGVAGAAAVVGLVLFLTAEDESESEPGTGDAASDEASLKILPVAGKDAAGLAASIRF